LHGPIYVCPEYPLDEGKFNLCAVYNPLKIKADDIYIYIYIFVSFVSECGGR